MFKKIILTLIILCFPNITTAYTPDPWSKQDFILESSFAAITIVDWAQTRYISRNPERFYEKNPILGKHPSTSKVDLYMGASILSHIVITHFLPAKWRPTWQCVWIILELKTVGGNNQVGIGVRW